MEGLNFFRMSLERDEAESTGERNGGGHVVWRHGCVVHAEVGGREVGPDLSGAGQFLPP